MPRDEGYENGAGIEGCFEQGWATYIGVLGSLARLVKLNKLVIIIYYIRN